MSDPQVEHDRTRFSSTPEEALDAVLVGGDDTADQADHVLPVVTDVIAGDGDFWLVSQQSFARAGQQVVLGSLDVSFDEVNGAEAWAELVQRGHLDGIPLCLADDAIQDSAFQPSCMGAATHSLLKHNSAAPESRMQRFPETAPRFKECELTCTTRYRKSKQPLCRAAVHDVFTLLDGGFRCFVMMPVRGIEALSAAFEQFPSVKLLRPEERVGNATELKLLKRAAVRHR